MEGERAAISLEKHGLENPVSRDYARRDELRRSSSFARLPRITSPVRGIRVVAPRLLLTGSRELYPAHLYFK
jgi:hypothetical protein